MFDIGLRIKDLRESRGLSGKQLAMELNFSQSFISQIEKGNKKCSLETLVEICNTLHVSLSDFFSIEEPLPDPLISPSTQRLMNTCQNLSEEEIEYLTTFIEMLLSKK